MTTYFVDPDNGSNKKGDGLTPDKAFQTMEHAEYVMMVEHIKNRRRRYIQTRPYLRRILWPWLTKKEIGQLGASYIYPRRGKRKQ